MKEYKPLVSIICPVYNQSRYIYTCINSVLKQSYQNWELIVIDDESTDNTYQIVKEFQDSRIKVIRQRHRGIMRLGETYNYGLKNSSGELIAILEGDDYWPSYKLEKQIHYFRKSNVILSFGQVIYVDKEGRRLCNKLVPNLPEVLNSPVGKAIGDIIWARMFIPSGTVMVRKDALEAIGGFVQPKGFPAVDYPTWLNLALLGEFRFVKAPLWYYRIHEGQTTAIYRIQQAMALNEYLRDFIQKLPSYLRKSIFHKESDIELALKWRLSSAYLDYARRLLIKGERSSAFRLLLKSMIEGRPKTKRTAMIVLLGCFGFDSEKLIASLGGVSFKTSSNIHEII